MITTMQANIKKQLSDKNMTAAELERRTGIPHAVVNILHGRSKNPSIKTAQAIAKELGCSVEELLTEPSAETNSLKTNPKAASNNTQWQAELYKLAFNAVYTCITTLDLAPDPKLVSECITEVYLYTLGSPQKDIDQRFVHWLIDKTIKHPGNKTQD
jgi:transcriptional regulator with XRE-family HTH domain